MKKLITYIICISLLSSVILFSGTSYDIFASTGTTKSTSTSNNSSELKPKLDNIVGKYGYVDKKGKWVITPQFLDAKDFSEGLAVVRYFINSDVPFSGYIDSKGNPAFNNKFYGGYDFKNGYAVVLEKDEKVSIIDKKGKVVLKTNYYFYNSKPQVAGILMEICEFPTARGPISPKVGYITNTLKLIKPIFDSSPSYYYLQNSKEGFLHASYAEYDSNNRLIKLNRYIINSKLEPVKLPSDLISSISEGMILLQCDKYYAFVNMEGKVFDEIYDSKTKKKHKFERAENFSDGHAVVQVKDTLEDPYGKKVPGYGYINKDGSTFKEPVYVSANSFSGGLAAVQPSPNYLYGSAILKSNGKYLLPPEVRTKAKVSEKYKEYFTNGLYTQEEYDYVLSEIKKIVNQVTNNNMSEIEKIEALHKYVMDHAHYGGNMEYDPTPRGLLYCHEAIGILKEGEGVCDAYSRLVGLLLTEVGIENEIVSGKVEQVGAQYKDNHAWNLVKVGGNYYHLDATFHDGRGEGDGKGPYDYFLVSDKYLKSLEGRFKREWKYSSYPAATKGYFNDQSH